jgi:hypothetical protein
MVQQTQTLPEHVTRSQYRFSQEFRVIVIICFTYFFTVVIVCTQIVYDFSLYTDSVSLLNLLQAALAIISGPWIQIHFWRLALKYIMQENDMTTNNVLRWPLWMCWSICKSSVCNDARCDSKMELVILVSLIGFGNLIFLDW